MLFMSAYNKTWLIISLTSICQLLRLFTDSKGKRYSRYAFHLDRLRRLPIQWKGELEVSRPERNHELVVSIKPPKPDAPGAKRLLIYRSQRRRHMYKILLDVDDFL